MKENQTNQDQYAKMPRISEAFASIIQLYLKDYFHIFV